MKEKSEPLNNLTNYFDTIIGEGAIIKKRKKTERERRLESFVNIIRQIEQMDIRSHMAYNELKIDMSSYDEIFYSIIFNIIEYTFGKSKSTLIYYYLYERIKEDGTPNVLKNKKGDVIQLETPEDLFYVLEALPNIHA